MKIRQTYGSAVIIVVIAMIIILPLLAYLQYTWLGQISEQEYERMKGNLQTAAFHCSMDFSREITDLMKSLSGTLSGSDDNVQKIIHERIIKWKATSTYPATISGEVVIASFPNPIQTISITVDKKTTVLLYKNLSALALPIENRPHQFVLVSLNSNFISSTILPKVIETNFSSSTRSGYDIMITDDRGNAIYNSVDSLKHNVFEKADIVAPFLYFPPAPPSSMPLEQPDIGRICPDREKPPEPFERNPREYERDRDFPPPQEKMEPEGYVPRMREYGLFELWLKHREGSLEVAINNSRLLNLGLGLGVLILLGASIIFLLLSTNRARWLARQQLEFVAGVSHELRTPLTVFKSAGENLADGVIHGKNHTRKYGELIKNEVIRLSEMVEKALAYAGIQSGKHNYELHPLNIAPIITEAIQNTKKLLPMHNFTVETPVDHRLPQVFGDATALQSALENLIINGIKYSLEKKWIRIEAYQTKSSREPFIEIKILDHGVGIAAADISNIFKPFYRGRGAIEGQIQGSGLGLSITKHIIESHGGTISVKSSPNEESVFTILLPSIVQEKESK
jgi:two-component system sensor histidine kinase SenX3